MSRNKIKLKRKEIKEWLLLFVGREMYVCHFCDGSLPKGLRVTYSEAERKHPSSSELQHCTNVRSDFACGTVRHIIKRVIYLIKNLSVIFSRTAMLKRLLFLRTEIKGIGTCNMSRIIWYDKFCLTKKNLLFLWIQTLFFKDIDANLMTVILINKGKLVINIGFLLHHLFFSILAYRRVTILGDSFEL